MGLPWPQVLPIYQYRQHYQSDRPHISRVNCCAHLSWKKGGVAYVCFEQAKALCERDKKMDDSEFRADASDPGTAVQSLILSGEEPHEQFQYWVERLNMGHFLHRGLRFISTGEMRKALLVKAILSQPGLLILDSPLDGLDLSSQEEMQTIINELLQSHITVLMLCRQMEDVPTGITPCPRSR